MGDLLPFGRRPGSYRIDLVAGIGDPLVTGSEGDILHNQATIREIQIALQNLGLGVGPGGEVGDQFVDGIWGPNTQNATLAFQIEKNFPADFQDGLPGPETLDALGVAVSQIPQGQLRPPPPPSPPRPLPPATPPLASAASGTLAKVLLVLGGVYAGLWAYKKSKKGRRR